MTLTAELSGKIDAFSRGAHRCGLSVNIVTACERFDNVARDLFKKIQWHEHCLNNYPMRKIPVKRYPCGHQV